MPPPYISHVHPVSFDRSRMKGCEAIGVSPQSSSSVSEAGLESECLLRKGEGDREMLMRGTEDWRLSLTGLKTCKDILERGLSLSKSRLPEELLWRWLDRGRSPLDRR